jgi:hypothetical protein
MTGWEGLGKETVPPLQVLSSQMGQMTNSTLITTILVLVEPKVGEAHSPFGYDKQGML